MLFPILVEIGTSETAFGVVVPDLPGLFAAGDTMEEAIADAKSAIYSRLFDICAEKARFPSPTPIDEFIKNNMLDGFFVALIEVDERNFLGKSVKINVTLPDFIINRIDEEVKVNPMYASRSNFILISAIAEINKIERAV